MIWGKTDKQRTEAAREDWFKIRKGYWIFAFIPHFLKDGRKIWLQRVFKRYEVYEGAYVAGNWVYYEKEPLPLT